MRLLATSCYPLLLLLLSACGMLAHVQVSKPFEPVPSESSELHGECHGLSRSPDVARIELERLTVLVSACDWNFQAITVGPSILPILPWPPGIVSSITGSSARPLWIELSFQSEASIEIGPEDPTVTLESGESFTPRRLYASSQSACGWRPYGEPSFKAKPLEPGRSINLEGPASVALMYEVPPSSTKTFSLNIRKLRFDDGSTLSLPSVRFREEADWLFCAGA